MADAAKLCIGNKSAGIFVMTGHENGIVAYGEHANDAGNMIIETLKNCEKKSGINMRIANVIEEKLLSAFSPTYLDVINESHQHNVAPGSESHFKVVIVSKLFEGERLIKRHRAINTILADELENKIHALALHTYTEKEWQEYYAENTPSSPKCMSGSKK